MKTMSNLLIFKMQRESHLLLSKSKKHDNTKVEVVVENKHLDCVRNVD